MINRRRLLNLTRELIAIDSQNPPGNEAAVARFVGARLRAMGHTPEFIAYGKNRTNVLCRVKGTGAKSLLITPHLDTVPAGKGWKHDPFSATLVKGRLYGLGATDCKGNLACCLEAMNSLAEERVKLGYTLVFAATADEESGSRLGLEPLLAKGALRADAAIVLDCEDFEIIAAQKGLLHVTLKVRGKRAHGAYPWLGVNAIDAAARIVCALKERKLSGPRNRYLHPATVNIGVIRGGDKVNVVADWCEVELDFRFLPGMRAGALVRMLKTTARRFAKDFEIVVDGVQQPYVISDTHRLVVSLKKSMEARGLRPVISGSEGATVISFFQRLGIPSVATGFGTTGCCHIADEYVAADNLWKGAGALEEFLKTFSFGS